MIIFGFVIRLFCILLELLSKYIDLRASMAKKIDPVLGKEYQDLLIFLDIK